MLGRVLSRLAPAQLLRRVDPFEEALAVLLDHGANSSAFDDFSAEADGVHDGFLLGYVWPARKRTINQLHHDASRTAEQQFAGIARCRRVPRLICSTT